MPLTAATAQSSGEDLTGLVGWIADVIESLGPVGVGLMVALENIFPPIPSEIVLPFAGFTAGRGGTGVWVMVAASTAGSVGGAIVLYELGRRIGQQRTKNLLCHLPLVEAADVERGVEWFTRHGAGAVFTGRFLPVVRSLVSLPAGAAEMPRARFLVLTSLGTAIWNTVWVWAGYLLGNQWNSVAQYSDLLNYAFWAAILVLLARFLWRRRDRFTDPPR